jgi:diguanylate cyclase
MFSLSSRGMGRVWLGTVVGTLFCVGVATLVDSVNFADFNAEELRQAMTVNILLPTLLAGPLLFLLLHKIRALNIAHHEMSVMATTDGLTSVLNRGAFNMLVEAYLTQAKKEMVSTGGSLLILDADHFKSINDRFGHQVGDEALRLIARQLGAVTRRADLVGRIGGEEFGIFLPGTSATQAMTIAERVRELVAEAPFPDSEKHSLSVSIGGVTFRNESDYQRLFRVADRCLYEAKMAGRNQVKMADYDGLSLAA